MSSARVPATSASGILNINVGVLGHVDSGKTSLVAALSTTLSTAALDKNPQSKERGITLDLGFSSFIVPMPEHLLATHGAYSQLQFTLVDCPGHASLIRTIIGGVQIIDMVILVVDVNKGLQTQTAECLVVAEIATSRMLVVLNKVDMLPEEGRPKAIKKAIRRLATTFDMTKFAGLPMVPVAAKPGARDGAPSTGVDDVRAHLLALVPSVPRSSAGPFLFAVDHCFPIKGQGTVLTGTVLQGTVSVNQSVELPALRLTRGVRSMQMFRRPTQRAAAGDRVGICLTQLDAALVERGLLAAPGTVPTFSMAIAAVEKIRFYSGKVCSKARFHISVGHATVMAQLHFFGLPEGQGVPQEQAMQQMVDSMEGMSIGSSGGASPLSFDLGGREYLHQDELYGLEGRPLAPSTATLLQLTETSQEAASGERKGDGESGDTGGGAEGEAFERAEDETGRHFGKQWVLLRFETPVTAPKDALVIGARLDADIHGEACRLAFYGRIVCLLDPAIPTDIQKLRVFKPKERVGAIERILPDGSTAIVRGLSKKETDVTIFVGLKVTTGRGEVGVIVGSFGKSGKLRVEFSGGLSPSPTRSTQDGVVVLRCKRYMYQANSKRLLQ